MVSHSKTLPNPCSKLTCDKAAIKYINTNIGVILVWPAFIKDIVYININCPGMTRAISTRAARAFKSEK